LPPNQRKEASDLGPKDICYLYGSEAFFGFDKTWKKHPNTKYLIAGYSTENENDFLLKKPIALNLLGYMSPIWEICREDDGYYPSTTSINFRKNAYKLLFREFIKRPRKTMVRTILGRPLIEESRFGDDIRSIRFGVETNPKRDADDIYPAEPNPATVDAKLVPVKPLAVIVTSPTPVGGASAIFVPAIILVTPVLAMLIFPMPDVGVIAIPTEAVAFVTVTLDRPVTVDKRLGEDIKSTKLGVETRFKRFSVETILTRFGVDTKFSKFGVDTMFTKLGEETKSNKLGLDTKLRKLGLETKPNRFGDETKLNKLGLDIKLNKLGDDTKLRRLGVDMNPPREDI
jgi:hypothetical protein